MAEHQSPPGHDRRRISVRLSEVSVDTTYFEGTDVPVPYLFDYMDARYNLYTFLRDFPTVSVEQTTAAIRQRVRTEIPVESVRGRVSGTPVFKDSRLPIRLLFDHLIHGESVDDFLENYPSAERELVVRLLELTCEMMEAVAYENAAGLPPNGTTSTRDGWAEAAARTRERGEDAPVE